MVPENTPCEANANTLLAPNSLSTSAALHNVPAVSTMSSTGRTGNECVRIRREDRGIDEVIVEGCELEDGKVEGCRWEQRCILLMSCTIFISTLSQHCATQWVTYVPIIASQPSTVPTKSMRSISFACAFRKISYWVLTLIK